MIIIQGSESVVQLIAQLALLLAASPNAINASLYDKLSLRTRARMVVETVASMADWGRKRDGRGMGFAFLNYSDSLVAGFDEYVRS
jgi:hypothetical protein